MRVALLVLVVGASCVGCSDPRPDHAPPLDGSGIDAAPQDAGPVFVTDAHGGDGAQGNPIDGGAGQDDGAVDDGGLEDDATFPDDTAVSSDASGFEGDGGGFDDGGSFGDAGGSEDAAAF